jgi:hypothetical protein
MVPPSSAGRRCCSLPAGNSGSARVDKGGSLGHSIFVFGEISLQTDDPKEEGFKNPRNVTRTAVYSIQTLIMYILYVRGKEVNSFFLLKDWYRSE